MIRLVPPTVERVSTAIFALLQARAQQATVCPSEVARALAADDAEAEAWRNIMPLVHEAVDRLLSEGHIQLSWKGRGLAGRAGPYRISRSGHGR